MISAPARAIDTAIAWPIPLVPPVTSAVCPLRPNKSVIEDIVITIRMNLRNVGFEGLKMPIVLDVVICCELDILNRIFL